MSVSQSQPLRSGVWEYFSRDAVAQRAECRLCNATLKAHGGSTKSLHTHLQSKHQLCVLKRVAYPGGEDGSDDESDVKPSIPPTSTSSYTAKATAMDKYLIKGELSMAATVSRMTACDGMSFSVFSTSTDLRRLMTSAGTFYYFIFWSFGLTDKMSSI